mgnify:CR=1 FL=1
MKLILTQEVSGLGAPGDVVEVKDGYGRNYLIPRGLGLRWTRGGERQIDQIKRARSAKEIRSLEHAQEVQAQLSTLAVSLPARAGEQHDWRRDRFRHLQGRLPRSRGQVSLLQESADALFRAAEAGHA